MKGCCAMITPILDVQDLDISFLQGRKTLKRTDHVSFSVNPGEIVCLVGESGCGKSITALSILGLLSRQGRVTAGRILYRGRDLLTLDERQLDAVRGREIAMIFQDIMYSLNPVFTIGSQLVEVIRRHLGYDRKKAEALAVELLDRTGLQQPAAVMRKYPHQLSGGMRQRAMIAMALACRPRLLIADEPTTALDVTIQLQIMQLLKSLRDETGMAILLITHDLGLVAEMADRVVVMYAGQCVETGDTRRLLAAPAHPYTRALLQAVPGVHDARDRRLLSIPGAVPEDYHDMAGCRFAPRCPYSDVCGREAYVFEPEPGRSVRCCEAVAGGRDSHAG